MRLVFLILCCAMAGSVLAQPTPPVQRTPAPIPDDRPVSPTLQVRTQHGVQMDVWIDGERKGFTPMLGNLAPGTYFVTCWNTGLEPIIQEITIPNYELQIVEIPDRKLTAEKFPKIFEKVVKAYQYYPENVHIRIIAMGLAQDPTDFRGLLGRLPQDHRENPVVLFVRSKWQAAEGNLDVALDLIDKALADEPNYAGAWRLKVRILTAMGRYQDAVAHANEAVILEPQNPDSFLARAAALKKAGRERAAQIDYEYVLEFDPDNKEAIRGLTTD